jgi:hypothetical protein
MGLFMKKLVALCTEKRFSAEVLKTALVLFVGIALGSGFWIASTPMAHSETKLTPIEMIQPKLPSGKTIATASDTELLNAVCGAVKQWPKDAPLIIRTVAGARKSLRGDVLCMTVRCLKEKRELDCTWVTDVVRDWIKADPDSANQLIELVSDCSPDCRDPLQGLLIGGGAFANPPSNINPPPGSVGGGAAAGNTCVVCHNGANVQIACENMANYLTTHPGDTSGSCQVTSTTNK